MTASQRARSFSVWSRPLNSCTVDIVFGVNYTDTFYLAPYIYMLPDDTFLLQGPHESSPRVFMTHAPITGFEIETNRHVVDIRDLVRYPAIILEFQFQVFAKDVLRSANKLACVN